MLEKVHLLPFFSGHIFSALEIPEQENQARSDVFLFAAEKLNANRRTPLSSRIPCTASTVPGSGHARDRLHWCRAQLSRSCRRADEARRRNGDTPLGGAEKRDRALSEWSADA